MDIEPFKGLLLGLFFMSVGMGIDYRVVGQELFWISASVIGLFLLKSVITAVLCLAFGIPRHTSLETGLLLGQGGEFAFVVVSLAMGLGLIPLDVGQFMLIVTGLTMVITPFVAASGSRLARGLEPPHALESSEQLPEDASLEGHMVLAGFGRVGHLLGRTLDSENIPYIALDTNPNIVAAGKESALPVYFGDAARLEMLRRAGLDRACALLVTMDNPAAAENVVRTARKQWPNLSILARARDPLHAQRLRVLGASETVLETVEASLQLSTRALQTVGVSEDVARRRADAQREIELGGPGAPQAP